MRNFLFLSTLSLRRATRQQTYHKDESQEFLSTLSLRRATSGYFRFSRLDVISIHALLAESDVCTTTITICTASFLSTLSLRRATCALRQLQSALRHFYPRSPCGERPPRCGWLQIFYYFYPRSPCGERPYVIGYTVNLQSISIHALLAESDSPRCGWLQIFYYFYPRSPCGERRQPTKTA